MVQVNGTSVSGMDHQSVVALLKEAGTSVCLVVSREVVPVTDSEVSPTSSPLCFFSPQELQRNVT